MLAAGRVDSSGAGSSALECELQLQARGLGGAGEWAAIWSCAALFTDDSARFESLQALNARQQQLMARQQELVDVLDGKHRVRVYPALAINPCDCDLYRVLALYAIAICTAKESRIEANSSEVATSR